MNPLNERLQRLKHSTEMAVTQASPAPHALRSAGLAPTPLVSPAAPTAAGGARPVWRVTARLVSPPASAAPAWPDPALLDSAPAGLRPGLGGTPGASSFPAPQAANRFPSQASPPGPVPSGPVEPLAGSPFGVVPPATSGQSSPSELSVTPLQAAAEVRRATFAEMLALNQPEGLPAVQNVSPEQGPPASPASVGVSAQAPSPFPSLPTPKASALPQVSAAPSGPPAELPVAPSSSSPASAPRGTPAEEVPGATTVGSAPRVAPESPPPPQREARRPEAAADATLAPAPPVPAAEQEPAGLRKVEAPGASIEAADGPVPQTPAPAAALVEASQNPAETTASPAQPGTAADPAPAPDTAAQEAAAPEEPFRPAAFSEEERRSLEALLRGNTDLPVRLPRRARPPAPRLERAFAEPEAPLPPPPPPEVAQSFLARLNRYADLEAQGEVESQTLPFDQLARWEDHHPERNVIPEALADAGADLPSSPAPAGPTAGAVLESAPPVNRPARATARVSPPRAPEAAPAVPTAAPRETRPRARAVGPQPARRDGEPTPPEEPDPPRPGGRSPPTSAQSAGVEPERSRGGAAASPQEQATRLQAGTAVGVFASPRPASVDSRTPAPTKTVLQRAGEQTATGEEGPSSVPSPAVRHTPGEGTTPAAVPPRGPTSPVLEATTLTTGEPGGPAGPGQVGPPNLGDSSVLLPAQVPATSPEAAAVESPSPTFPHDPDWTSAQPGHPTTIGGSTGTPPRHEGTARAPLPDPVLPALLLPHPAPATGGEGPPSDRRSPAQRRGLETEEGSAARFGDGPVVGDGSVAGKLPPPVPAEMGPASAPPPTEIGPLARAGHTSALIAHSAPGEVVQERSTALLPSNRAVDGGEAWRSAGPMNLGDPAEQTAPQRQRAASSIEDPPYSPQTPGVVELPVPPVLTPLSPRAAVPRLPEIAQEALTSATAPPAGAQGERPPLLPGVQPPWPPQHRATQNQPPGGAETPRRAREQNPGPTELAGAAQESAPPVLLLPTSPRTPADDQGRPLARAAEVAGEATTRPPTPRPAVPGQATAERNADPAEAVPPPVLPTVTEPAVLPKAALSGSRRASPFPPDPGALPATAAQPPSAPTLAAPEESAPNFSPPEDASNSSPASPGARQESPLAPSRPTVRDDRAPGTSALGQLTPPVPRVRQADGTWSSLDRPTGTEEAAGAPQNAAATAPLVPAPLLDSTPLAPRPVPSPPASRPQAQADVERGGEVPAVLSAQLPPVVPTVQRAPEPLGGAEAFPVAGSLSPSAPQVPGGATVETGGFKPTAKVESPLVPGGPIPASQAVLLDAVLPPVVETSGRGPRQSDGQPARSSASPARPPTVGTTVSEVGFQSRGDLRTLPTLPAAPSPTSLPADNPSEAVERQAGTLTRNGGGEVRPSPQTASTGGAAPMFPAVPRAAREGAGRSDPARSEGAGQDGRAPGPLPAAAALQRATATEPAFRPLEERDTLSGEVRLPEVPQASTVRRATRGPDAESSLSGPFSREETVEVGARPTAPGGRLGVPPASPEGEPSLRPPLSPQAAAHEAARPDSTPGAPTPPGAFARPGPQPSTSLLRDEQPPLPSPVSPQLPVFAPPPGPAEGDAPELSAGARLQPSAPFPVLPPAEGRGAAPLRAATGFDGRGGEAPEERASRPVPPALPGAPVPPAGRPGAPAPALPATWAPPRAQTQRSPLGERGEPGGFTGPGGEALSPVLARALKQAVAQDGHGQPLPLGVQEALAETLGLRVPQVRVVRHAGAAEPLRLAGADALAVGETVVLPPDLALDGAAGHALLTHELTHVLRRTQPGFVPRVVQDEVRAPHDEEQVARHAEGRARERFGGLPAPWEPMPFWDTPAPATSAPPPPAPAAPVAVHAAAKDRPTAAPAPSNTPAAPKGDGSEKTTGSREHTRAPAPDLDQLARDVYDRLKSRLATEFSRLN